MANEPVASQKAAAGETSARNVGIELVASGDSDQPVLSNIVMLQPTPGVVLIDFGFVEPGAMAAVSQMARTGKKLPERMKGRLAVRVALSYDVLANLHQQAGRLLVQTMGAAADKSRAADKK
jgi:hypothetical protein